MARAVISKVEGRGKSNLPESKLERHRRIIQDAYQDYNRSFATFVKALAAAKKELGKDTLDKEIAANLGISKATMSRHMTVAECEPLVERLSKLPKAMCALYPLARMREIHLKLADGDVDKAERAYTAVLEKCTIDTKTADIEKQIKNLERQLSKKHDKEQEARVASSLDGKLISSKTPLVSPTKKTRTPGEAASLVSIRAQFCSNIPTTFTQ